MTGRFQLKREEANDGTGSGTGAGAAGAGGGDLLNASSGGGAAAQGASGTGSGTGAGGAASGGQGASGGTGGDGSADWKSALPTELRDNQTLGRYKSIADLANGYINLQRHYSGEKLVIPGKNASDEDWKQVYEKLGVPKDPKDYNVKFQDGVTIDEKFAGSFKDLAHKAGILPKQAQALADWFGEQNKNAEGEYKAAIDASRAKALQDLRTEWGEAYGKKLGMANAVFAELPENLQTTLKEVGLNNNVHVVRAMAEIAAKYKAEDQIKGPDGGGIAPRHTPESAKKAADAIMGDMNHPYHQKEHPGHKAAVKEVADLFNAMHFKP